MWFAQGNEYSTGYLCVIHVERSGALMLWKLSHGHRAVTMTRLCSMVLLTLVSVNYSRSVLGKLPSQMTEKEGS